MLILVQSCHVELVWAHGTHLGARLASCIFGSAVHTNTHAVAAIFFSFPGRANLTAERAVRQRPCAWNYNRELSTYVFDSRTPTGGHYFGIIYCLKEQHERKTASSHVCDFLSNTSTHAHWLQCRKQWLSVDVRESNLIESDCMWLTRCLAVCRWAAAAGWSACSPPVCWSCCPSSPGCSSCCGHSLLEFAVSSPAWSALLLWSGVGCWKVEQRNGQVTWRPQRTLNGESRNT